MYAQRLLEKSCVATNQQVQTHHQHLNGMTAVGPAVVALRSVHCFLEQDDSVDALHHLLQQFHQHKYLEGRHQATMLTAIQRNGLLDLHLNTLSATN